MKHIQINGKTGIYYIFPGHHSSLSDEDYRVGKSFIAFRYPDGKRFSVRHIKSSVPDFALLSLLMYHESLVKNMGKSVAGAIEVIRQDDHLFIVKEFPSDMSLKKLLRQESFKSRSKLLYVLNLFREILKSISHLHENGIIHAGLRPATVYLEDYFKGYSKRCPKIIISDFSLCKTKQFEPPKGASLPVGYMYNAPEVVLSRYDLFCPATDVYSIGIMLYEMLKGHHPHRIKHPRVVGDMHLAAPLKDFGGIHPEIVKIIKKACEKEVFVKPIHYYNYKQVGDVLLTGIEKRYLSAEDMLADIENVIDLLFKKKEKCLNDSSKSIVTVNPLVVFDDECVLCGKALKYMMRHDTNRVLRYRGLSDVSNDNVLYQKASKSVVLIENEKVYVSSDAFIRIMQLIGGWNSLYVILKIVPRFIRNVVYNMVAKKRYRWWGKRDQCYLPPLREKYLFSDTKE
jgi:predicted DCC family thiol-disulfide oxidoreductase YuxK